MAHFFGTVQGGRGKATRLGHQNTGLKVTAQSYSGSVIINLYHNEVDHTDCISIDLANDSKEHGDISLYCGPIKGLFNDQLNLLRR